ncbi:MAG: hypothetical protein ACKOXJ_06645, partial [Alphaproteobacteria bacterium]
MGENKTDIFDKLNRKYPGTDFKKFILEDLTTETRYLLTKNREKLKSELKKSTKITDQNGKIANDKLIKFLEEYYKCKIPERKKIVRDIVKSSINRLETIPEGDEKNGVEGARAEKVNGNGRGKKSI